VLLRVEERPFKGRVFGAPYVAFRPSGATRAEARRPMATQRGAEAPLFDGAFRGEESLIPVK